MPTKPMSELALRNLKPRDREYKVSDGGGLFVIVQTNGTKRWRLAYRHGGKQRALSFGVYPAVGLADARSKREAAKLALRAGEDPGAALPAALPTEAVPLPTFQQVAEQWFALQLGRWDDVYAGRVRSRLEADVYPVIGSREIAALEPLDMLAMVRKMEARGIVEVPRRVMNLCGRVFRFGVATGVCQADSTRDIGDALKVRPPVQHRRKVESREMAEMMAKLAAYDGEEQTKLAIRLTMLTMVRTNEARFAVRSEFEDLDGAAPLWRIPAVRMKMEREHLVPLSPQAVAVVKRLLEISGNANLLPSFGRKGVISENTMLYALYRMGYHGRATIHGFRGTASTVLNQADFNGDWIERQLAHVEGNKVRGAYNSAQWLPQRRDMLNWWADWLDKQDDLGRLLG